MKRILRSGWRTCGVMLAALALPACATWPSTKMEPAAQYATRFVCPDGGTWLGDDVEPGQLPPC